MVPLFWMSNPNSRGRARIQKRKKSDCRSKEARTRVLRLPSVKNEPKSDKTGFSQAPHLLALSPAWHCLIRGKSHLHTSPQSLCSPFRPISKMNILLYLLYLQIMLGGRVEEFATNQSARRGSFTLGLQEQAVCYRSRLGTCKHRCRLAPLGGPEETQQHTG